MNFGEIIEPSTRALILDDEELKDLPTYEKPYFEWTGISEPPNEIENLIIIESSKTVQFSSNFIENPPIASVKNAGLLIYKFGNKIVIVFDDKTKNVIIGEVVELLSEWINKSKEIHAITSLVSSSFQQIDNTIKESTFSRCLTQQKDVPFKFCKFLESPNLILGLGAGILTYCIYKNRSNATLWIIYTDNFPMDSENSREFKKLFTLLGLLEENKQIKFSADNSNSSSNLYM